MTLAASRIGKGTRVMRLPTKIYGDSERCKTTGLMRAFTGGEGTAWSLALQTGRSLVDHIHLRHRPQVDSPAHGQ